MKVGWLTVPWHQKKAFLDIFSAERATSACHESVSISLLTTYMGWLHSLLSPFKRLWNRLHSTHIKRKDGLYILYEDVKCCSCEDVQMLWSMLVESHDTSLEEGMIDPDQDYSLLEVKMQNHAGDEG